MNKNGLKCTMMGLVLSGSLLAQTESTTTTVEESSDKYKVETNRFFDNCFIGAGIGGQIYFGENDSKYSLTNRITPSFNIYVGKWFTPGIGIRVGVDGSNAKGLSLNNSSWYEQFYENGDTYTKDGVSYFKQKIKYARFTGEALFNVSNLFLGYNEKRFYNFIPYAGAGYIESTNKSHHEEELFVDGGILNTFRLTNALDLTLDLKGCIFNSHFSHKEDMDVNLPARADKIASVSVGVVYRFKKLNWDKSKNTTTTTSIVTYDEKELNKLRQKNQDLEKQLANGKNSSKTDTVIDRSVLAPPLLITFTIDKWDLSKEARVNLGYFAKIVKSKPHVIYFLTGYADKGTGSAERNVYLSKQRVNVVYNALVNEFGVNPNQLQTKYEGGVENMFYDDPRLSRSVVAFEIKK